MTYQFDGFDSNTHAFAKAISEVVPAEAIASAIGNPGVHAPRILKTLRQDMPKEQQDKFRDMFCGCSPRSNATERVLLSAVRESINLLSLTDLGEASK